MERHAAPSHALRVPRAAGAVSVLFALLIGSSLELLRSAAAASPGEVGARLPISTATIWLRTSSRAGLGFPRHAMALVLLPTNDVPWVDLLPLSGSSC